MAKDLSVITLTRDHPEYVEALTENLRLVTPPGLEVERILVNNGAPRQRTTWDPVTKAAVQAGWKVVEPGYNASFSAGNNLGAKAAEGEYLLLLNDDAKLEPPALYRLWEAREKAEILGCLIVESNGQVNHAGTEIVDWPDHIGRGDPVENWWGQGVLRREAVTFACVLISAAWYAKLGGLDEAYVYSFEDTDLCVRTMVEGGRIAVHTGAIVNHDECGTRPRGGQNDVANARRYRELWLEKVPQIVERYRADGR